MNYCTYARANGARICNDGYPDCRFSATYGDEHQLARRYVARLRKLYEHDVWLNRTNYEAQVFKSATTEVGMSIIAKLKQELFNK